MWKARMNTGWVTVGGVAFSQIIQRHLVVDAQSAASIQFMIGLLTAIAAIVTYEHFKAKVPA